MDKRITGVKDMIEETDKLFKEKVPDTKNPENLDTL